MRRQERRRETGERQGEAREGQRRGERQEREEMERETGNKEDTGWRDRYKKQRPRLGYHLYHRVALSYNPNTEDLRGVGTVETVEISYQIFISTIARSQNSPCAFNENRRSQNFLSERRDHNRSRDEG